MLGHLNEGLYTSANQRVTFRGGYKAQLEERFQDLGMHVAGRSAVRTIYFNAFTTGKPFFTKLFAVSIGRRLGALKRLLIRRPEHLTPYTISKILKVLPDQH